MSIPYRQRRLLRRIDHSLRQSDPDLQSMLLIFARLNAGEEMPAWEQLPGAEPGSRHMVWPTELTPYPGPFFFLAMQQFLAMELERRWTAAACSFSACSGSTALPAMDPPRAACSRSRGRRPRTDVVPG